ATEGNERLLDKFAIGRDTLHALVATIRDIYEAVVGNIHIMHRRSKLLQNFRDRNPGVSRRLGAWRTRVAIEWLVAIRTPHALELPRVCVIHHDPAVAVSVADEEFVRFRVNIKPGRAYSDLPRIASALAPV